MAQAAHPAFPSLIPNPASPSAGGQVGSPTIRSSKTVRDIISNNRTLESIRDRLIPALSDVTGGRGQPGSSPREKADAGQDITAIWEDDIYGMQAEQIAELTAGLVFIVSSRLNRPIEGRYNVDLFNFAVELCKVGNVQQLKLASTRVSNLAWGILRLAQQLKQPELALQPLQTLISRSSEPCVFSGVYAAFLEGCLITRQLQSALSTLKLVFVDFIAGGPTYLDVLTYYHHAGLVAAAVQRFSMAKQLFSVAVSVPTSTASAIQLAAAKRAILCGLLDDGKLVALPQYTSGAVSRMVERNAKEYTKLARAFENEEWDVVSDTAAGKDFTDDCNFGLLQQVLSSIPRRRILKLQTTYSKMKLNDLAHKVGLTGVDGVKEVGNILQVMIAARTIGATISTDATPVVTFHEDNVDYNAPEMLQEIANVTAMASWLEQELVRANKRMGISRGYLNKQVGVLEATGGKGGGKNGKASDFDVMMAAENVGVGQKSAGADYEDMGY